MIRLNQQIINQLLELQNPDGGWGSEQRRQSNTEATAYALMALSSGQETPDVRPHVQRGFSWLVNLQHSSGSWPLSAKITTATWATSLAIIALAGSRQYRKPVLRGAGWLLDKHGVKPAERHPFVRLLTPKKTLTMQPDRQGWPWVLQTANWAEPTAYALIALKKLGPLLDNKLVRHRVRQGEQFLYDRMCVGGGWNYGNSVALDEQLSPYPDTTAVCLVALQNRQTQHENQVSLQTLNKMIHQEQSGLALSWTIICLSLYTQDTSWLREKLVEQYHLTQFLGQTKSLALSLMALGKRNEYFQV